MSDKITARKSFKEGHVAVRVSLSGRGWQSASVKVEGSTDLTSEQARELAVSLLSAADSADAKVAAKQASEERRRKWRDREVAAGRLKIVSASSFFGGRNHS